MIIEQPAHRQFSAPAADAERASRNALFVLHAPLGDDFLNGTDVILSSLAGEPPP